jgi:signal transduction histidine kinase
MTGGRAAISRVAVVRSWVGAVLLVNLFVAGLAVLLLNQSRRQLEDQAAANVANLSLALQGDIAGTLQSVNLALFAMADEYARQLAAGGFDVAAMDRFIARQRPRLPEVDALRMADAAAKVVCGTDVIPGSAVDIADRAYFIRLRDDAKAGLVFSGPLQSRVNRKWVVFFARRLDRPDGRFAGVVYAPVALDQFISLFAGIDVGRRGSISLRDREGRILARYPVPADGGVIGRALSVPQFLALAEADGELAAYVSDRTVDGVERRFSVRRIPGQPLYIVVGRSTVDDLATWRDQAAKAGLLLVLFLVGTLASSWLIYRGWQRQVAAADEVARAEEQVRRLNSELEQRVAERTAELEAANKELEEFSYSVSHDLRSPLRAIDGFGRILEEEYGPRLDDEGRRLVGIVAENARRMGLLIDGILAFLHLGRQPLRVLPVDMDALARDVFAELAPADRRIGFEVGNLPPARGDAGMLRRVLAELLSNAIRFSARDDQALIQVGGSDGEEQNSYYVRDNGIGFDMRYADKLFRVFERLHGDAQLEGTGIGLAMVKRIVHRHGGRVWAEGKIGEGATVYFTLPTNKGEKK